MLPYSGNPCLSSWSPRLYPVLNPFLVGHIISTFRQYTVKTRRGILAPVIGYNDILLHLYLPEINRQYYCLHFLHTGLSHHSELPGLTTSYIPVCTSTSQQSFSNLLIHLTISLFIFISGLPHSSRILGSSGLSHRSLGISVPVIYHPPLSLLRSL